MARNSRCVLIERCADFILCNQKPFRIFVSAERASKMKRRCEKVPKDRVLSEK